MKQQMKTKKANGICKTCYGYGLWPDGTAPMGPMDASDHMPTIACPECKANANPRKKGSKVRTNRNMGQKR